MNDQREYWRSDTAQELYWGDAVPEGGPFSLAPEGPGWYYAPCMDASIACGPLATLHPPNRGIGRARKFKRAWKIWREIGPTAEARRARRALKYPKPKGWYESIPPLADDVILAWVNLPETKPRRRRR